MAKLENPRNSIVTLTARAAVRFVERQQIEILATPQSTIPLDAVRLRNYVAYSGDARGDTAPTFIGGFSAEAIGRFATGEEAVEVLGNVASAYFQMIALACNVGVEEPEDLVAYSPPVDATDEGAFVVQRHSQPRAPAARLRKVDAKDVGDLLLLLDRHPQQERIQRAMAHYRMALNQLDPMNRVLSAESLWMAVENLSHVVLDRLREEHGLPQTAEGKHRLALALGFAPKTIQNLSYRERLGLGVAGIPRSRLRSDSSHLGKLDGYIRREIIFAGDADCYKNLKDGSDGFEHGFMDFGLVQHKSKVADRAFTLIRRAILQEIGLPDRSALRDKRFDDPLGVWRPAIEVHGTYTDSNPAPLPLLTNETIGAPWPDVPGFSLVPVMSSVVDSDDGTRTISLEINGSMSGLTDTQAVKIHETKWLSPGASDDKVLSRRNTTRLNGQVIRDDLVVPDESNEDPSPSDAP